MVIGSALSVRLQCLMAVPLLVLLHGAAADDLSEAVALQQQQRWRQCLPVARKAVEERPWNESAWLALIESQLRTGDNLGAVRSFEDAFGRFSSSARLRLLGRDVFRGVGQAELGRMLVLQIDALAQQAPWRYSDAPSRVALGRFYLEQGADARQVLEVFYDQAKKDSPDYVDAYVASGELALEKGDFRLAGEAFQNALKLDDKRPDVLLGLSKSFAPSDSEQAAAYLEQALQLHPQHVPSLLEIADKQIDGELFEEAEQTLEKVLAANPEQCEAWAALAVLAHLRGDPPREQLCRRVALGWWPQNPQVDWLIGRKLSQKYRFAEGAEHQRQALKFDPEYSPAKMQLCQDLLRLGEEEEGWRLANEALDRDGYNVVAHNLVQLQTQLARFRTLESEHFLVRMDAREAAVYGDRVLRLLEQARQTLCDKYHHPLQGPVVVEIFPRQADFAIRTFGLPGGAGFLGVCFGKVITANSPASQGGSPSNWASVLWHEFCHVVTLQKTNNKMPRWLSEGISVYEERQQRGSWGQTMTPQYRQMVLDGELTPVSQLSNAFLRPPTAMHLQFAYYESSLVVEYLVQQHGFEALLQLLDQLGQGLPINDALARTAGSIESLNAGFEQFARQRAESLAPKADWDSPDEETQDDPVKLAEWIQQHPDSVWAVRRQVQQLIAAGQWQQALEPLQRLIQWLPEQTGEQSPLALLAQAYGQLGRLEEEREALERLLQVDSSAQFACLRLMEIADQQGKPARLLSAAQHLMEINPLQTAPHRLLAQAAEQTGDHALAADSLQALLQLGAADPAEAHYRLALALRRLGQGPRARRQVLKSLEVAPRYRDAQRLLMALAAADYRSPLERLPQPAGGEPRPPQRRPQPPLETLGPTP